MRNTTDTMVPRTTTDIVFERLREEIVTLKLLPGTKISEADVARRLDVSRQPVRDAFNRLGSLNLLWIRPQRATVVRGFSKESIDNARFVRLAIELEVIERACKVWDGTCTESLEENLVQQGESLDASQIDLFHELDYQFHKLICELGGHPLAFEKIEHCKREVDRLCMLSLGKSEEIKIVLDDHREIARALGKGSVGNARAIIRRHLSRLNDTINEIHSNHSEYFE